jgi:hypothetical protein
MNPKHNVKVPEYKCNEYLIVLNPNEDISDKIISAKKEISEKFKVIMPFLKPQIMLVRFIHFQMIEERLLTQLKNISNGYKPFQVKLKDYGSLPSHSIFINVESKQQIQNLVTELKSIRGLITFDKENKPHFIDDFYLLLAGKLLPWQYEKAWLEYNHRYFTASFIAGSFILLKRDLENNGNGLLPAGSYRLVQRFEFMNSRFITQQSQLFM